MPSRIDEAGHTKAFDYPVAEHWGESQRVHGGGGGGGGGGLWFMRFFLVQVNSFQVSRFPWFQELVVRTMFTIL